MNLLDDARRERLVGASLDHHVKDPIGFVPTNHLLIIGGQFNRVSD